MSSVSFSAENKPIIHHQTAMLKQPVIKLHRIEKEQIYQTMLKQPVKEQIYQTMLKQPVKEQIYQTMLKQPVIKLHRIGMCMFSSCHCTLCEYKRSSASSEHYQ